MSPEQVRGGVRLDARSDLYSFGALLYRMIAGRHYLDLTGRADFEARLAILEEAPLLPIQGAGDPLNEALAALLAKDPQDRPPSAAAVASDLRATVFTR